MFPRMMPTRHHRHRGRTPGPPLEGHRRLRRLRRWRQAPLDLRPIAAVRILRGVKFHRLPAWEAAVRSRPAASGTSAVALPPTLVLAGSRGTPAIYTAPGGPIASLAVSLSSLKKEALSLGARWLPQANALSTCGFGKLDIEGSQTRFSPYR